MQFPIRAIGELQMTFAKDISTCTASLVGPQHVLTAAHCVYDRSTDALMEHAYFVPGRDGDYLPYGMYPVTDLYMLDDYRRTEEVGHNPDFAILRLETPVGSQLGYLGMKAYVDPGTGLRAEIEAKLADYWTRTGDQARYYAYASKLFDEMERRYPQHTLQYFGYSVDKNREPWGDRCIAFKQAAYSNERIEQIQEFCDSQKGSSGSAYFDDDHYIRAVASWHTGEDGTEIRDNVGTVTGNYKGEAGAVRNFGVALNGYVLDLVNRWMVGEKPDGTIHRKFPSAHLKHFTVDIQCRDHLYLAIRYRKPDGDWVTEGFYELQGSGRVTRSTASDHVFYYAINAEGSREWSDDADRFALYGKSYGFRKVDLSRKYRSAINLECP